MYLYAAPQINSFFLTTEYVHGTQGNLEKASINETHTFCRIKD